MSRIVDEHRQYLTDEVRVDAFRRAVQAIVRPGDIVLDLASGTGILGLLAAQAGAAHVYSIESSSLIGLTRQIASANGWRDRFTFVREYSTFAELPDRGLEPVVPSTGRRIRPTSAALRPRRPPGGVLSLLQAELSVRLLVSGAGR